MIACSKEQLLVFDNSPVLLRAPGKRPQEATPQTLRNYVFLKSLVQDTHSPPVPSCCNAGWRWITIHRIIIRETNCVIHWIVVYAVDSVIHLLNNWRHLESFLISLQFDSSAMLLNNHLVCPLPVGFFNHLSMLLNFYFSLRLSVVQARFRRSLGLPREELLLSGVERGLISHTAASNRA